MQVNNPQSGFTIIEVLVAWVILSVVLLGIIQIETDALKITAEALWHSEAVVQLSSMLERLQVNRSPNAQVRELALWNAQNQSLLPKGHGEYQCVANQCRVTLIWQAQKTQQQSSKGLVWWK